LLAAAVQVVMEIKAVVAAAEKFFIGRRYHSLPVQLLA
jgi:hypothetical protein